MQLNDGESRFLLVVIWSSSIDWVGGYEELTVSTKAWLVFQPWFPYLPELIVPTLSFYLTTAETCGGTAGSICLLHDVYNDPGILRGFEELCEIWT
jgi:hypothetical protein